MEHHYQAEESCAKEKESLMDLFLDMSDLIKKTGDKNAIEALDKIYKEMIEKMNGKKILIDYIKKRNKTEEGEGANKVNVNNYDNINNTCNHLMLNK